ncbi:MAG: nucleoside-triphosphatase [Chitinophagaceae bacterium]
MNSRPAITPPGRSLVYYRLIALWVVVEAFVGGIIHGLRLPVSGLVIGSCAVTCVCLIGWYIPARGAILRATLIVAIFKMMLSPHAPLVAYIAVFFQGLLGELLLRGRKHYRAACLVLAMLALLESGLQRILILTIVYSNDLWRVINDFINKLTGQQVAFNYSLLLGGGYVVLHLVAGIIVGWWAGRLPQRIAQWSLDPQVALLPVAPANMEVRPPSLQWKRLKSLLFLVWIALLALYLQSAFRIGGPPLLPSHVSLHILVRSFVIVLSWYFLVRPLLKEWLGRWLQRRKGRVQADIRQVWQLLPDMQALAAQAWRQTANRGGWRRIAACSRLILARAFAPRQRRVFILTRPVRTGKTSSLLSWSEKHYNVYGILTPVTDGRRFFMDAHTRRQFAMEADGTDTDVIRVGRYTLSRPAFEQARQVIREAIAMPGWLVIDEVGPLELRGEGFAGVVQEALERQPQEQTILLVVREGLVEQVREAFGLDDAVARGDLFTILRMKSPVL